ncbi:unnamed protein product, partial [Staurois parvus]
PKHDSTTALLTSQPCWNRVAFHQPSTTLSIWTIHGCSRGTSSFKYLLLLCNGILAAALLIQCMDLAEIFLNVPLSAQTHLCSESATNLLIVR